MFSLPGNKGKPGADLRTSGILATAPGGHGTEYGVPIPTLQKPEEAQAFVDARIADGADYIKIVLDDGSAFGFQRPTLSEATVRALVQAAHKRGKLATVHIATKSDARVAMEAGADVLHHLFAGGPDEDLARMLGGKKAVLVPTLAALRTGCGAPGAALASDARIAPYLSEEATGNLRFAPGGAKRAEVCAEDLAALRQLKTAGVRILAGTDPPNPGTATGASLHGEMELLVQAGMSPVEALTAATSSPAAVFGLNDRGRIAKGMRADMILVDGDPTSDIRATRAIAGIWQQGIAVERKVY
jgi:imidazolonepropionase-like amidohydrolase